jgi:hypothetical protein
LAICWRRQLSLRVTDLIEPPTLELWLLSNPDLRHTARVKALMTCLDGQLKGQSDLYEGKQPQGKPVVKFGL